MTTPARLTHEVAPEARVSRDAASDALRESQGLKDRVRRLERPSEDGTT